MNNRPTLRPYQEDLVTGLADKLTSCRKVVGQLSEAQDKICGVYMLYWPSGHFYIGSSVDINRRYGQHLRHSKHCDHHNVNVLKISKKYGNPSIRIMKICAEPERLQMEQQYLDANFNNPFCCNISPSAFDSTGIKRRPETLKKMRNARLGKMMSEVTRKKISQSGKKLWAERPLHHGLSGEANPFYGKKHTEQARTKMRKSKNVGGNNIRARLVLNFETGIYYDCASEAASVTSYKPEHLRGMLNGNKKNKTGFRYV